MAMFAAAAGRAGGGGGRNRGRRGRWSAASTELEIALEIARRRVGGSKKTNARVVDPAPLGRMVRCWGGLRWGGEEGEEAGGYGFTIVE